ncbi:putative short-chain oxidoreductase [Triangularia verruculosa]|uniref:Short-chain oxidoreductase n=1 Tax=Triangularia verruculosa TaxID=2587418 RepID=A0AAN6XD14_9PEZI|nr:putative short-chain oxidoreductase [Triangularia verruculosa]
MSNDPPQGLTFLITGTSSGFGLLLSRLVLEQGHNLIATSRSPSRTPDVVAEILSHPGPGSRQWLQLDVNDLSSPNLINDLERSQNIAIDVLVNNAGFSIHAPAELLEEDELRGMMDTMYFGPARLMRVVLPFMRQRKRGVIVNMSSGAGLEGRESMAGYAAAKAALDGFSKVLGQEVAAAGIRVLTVQLGAFDTTMGDNARAGRRYREENLPGEYVGSMADQITKMLTEGGLAGFADGDPRKAVRAVYEVIVGEGAGADKEKERMLPLGRDVAVRIGEVIATYRRALEVFGDICNNVYRSQS